MAVMRRIGTELLHERKAEAAYAVRDVCIDPF
jgi:hypothetical protein